MNSVNRPLRLVLLLSVVVLVPGASTDSQVQLDLNRHRLKTMSAHERLRIQQNYERFRRLSSEEQQQLRKLHQEIQSRSDVERKALEELMVRYLGWLDTLAPKDRERLETIEDPTQKVLEIEKMVEEQRRQLRQDLQPLERFYREDTTAFEKEIQERRRAAENALPKVLKELDPKLTPVEKQWVAAADDKTSWFRKLMIVSLLAEKYDVELSEELRRAQWITDATFGKLDFLAHQFEFEEPDPAEKHRRGFRPLGLRDVRDDQRDLAREVYLQFLMLPRVPEEQLMAVYEKLDENQQFDIRNHWDRWTVDHPLTAHYYRANADKLPEELREVLLQKRRGQAGPPRNPVRPPTDRPLPERPRGRRTSNQ